MGRVGAVFRAVPQPDEIALFEHGAVILDQLAFEDQELFVAIVAVRPRRHAGRHPIDVKADPERLIVIELQNLVAESNAIVKYEGCEVRAVDVGDTPV